MRVCTISQVRQGIPKFLGRAGRSGCLWAESTERVGFPKVRGGQNLGYEDKNWNNRTKLKEWDHKREESEEF